MKYKLCEICKIINGRAYSYDELQEVGKYPVLRVGNFFSSDKWYYSDMELSPEKYCDQGDLLYAWSASFGPKIWAGEKVIYHYHIWKLIPNENIVSKYYLFYWLLDSASYIGSTNHGSVMAHLTKKDMENLVIELPDLEAQKRIVSVLRNLDSKIKINESINDNLEAQARLVFDEWFVKDGGSKTAGARDEALDSVVSIVKKTFNPEKEPVTQLEHYSIPAFDAGKFPVFESSLSIKSNKYIVDKDCFMISKLNPTTKRVWRPYCLTNQAVCSTEFIVFKAKGKAYTDYLYSLINCDAFSEHLCNHVTGSTGSRQRTNPDDALKFEFKMPTESVISEFSSIVAPMYEQIRTNAIENNSLKQLRDYLLPLLMSGQISIGG